MFQPLLSIQFPLTQKSDNIITRYIQEFKKEKKMGSVRREGAEGTLMEKEDNIQDDRERWG